MASDTEPVLVLGATGYTGRLVVAALERLGHPYVLAGRDAAKLEAQIPGLDHVIDARLADVTRSESLDGLFRGISAVVNTVGPFRRLGLPVVRAAIAQGVHYVDTTGEQGYQRTVYERCHRAAVHAEVTVVTGSAFEYAFSYCGAALLDRRCGPIAGVNTYHYTDGFRPSRGTATTVIEQLREPWLTYDDGKLVPLRPRSSPLAVRFPGEQVARYAVAIPGGDALMLPLDIATLRKATSYVLLTRFAAEVAGRAVAFTPRLQPLLGGAAGTALERLVDRFVQDPSVENREAVGWEVWVEALGPTGTHTCRIAGRDAYAISGDAAALTAVRLAEGLAKESGVMTTGRALDPVAFLDDLKPRGVVWELR